MPGEPLLFFTRRTPASNHSVVHRSSKSLRSSLNRSLPLISLRTLHEPFCDRRIIDSPALYVSGTRRLRPGWSRTHVFNKPPKPLACSALHLRPPWRCPDVFASHASPPDHRHWALRLLRLHPQVQSVFAVTVSLATCSNSVELTSDICLRIPVDLSVYATHTQIYDFLRPNRGIKYLGYKWGDGRNQVDCATG